MSSDAKVTDPEVEKFLDSLPFSVGWNKSDARNRLLALLQTELHNPLSELAVARKEIERLTSELAFEKQRQSEGYKVPALEKEIERLNELLGKFLGCSAHRFGDEMCLCQEAAEALADAEKEHK